MTRFFSYAELDDETCFVSVDYIEENYYPYWYKRMCDKCGKEFVDANCSFNDALSDWIVINYAQEIEEKDWLHLP